MLYFTGEGFHRLANQNRGHIRVMLEYLVYHIQKMKMHSRYTRKTFTSNMYTSFHQHTCIHVIHFHILPFQNYYMDFSHIWYVGVFGPLWVI